MAAALRINDHNDHSTAERMFINLLTLMSLGLLLYFAAGYGMIYFEWMTPRTEYGIIPLSSMELGIYVSLAILFASRAIMAVGGTNSAKIIAYIALTVLFFALFYWGLFTAPRIS